MDWPKAKLSMALRALRLEGRSESLDAIAEEFGVSRETVRRARNLLIHRVDRGGSDAPEAAAIVARAPEPMRHTGESQTRARALRRFLTMTGPLNLDEALSAWARASGKPPYTALPSSLSSLAEWFTEAGGLLIEDAPPIMLSVIEPEPLDQVSQFLVQALRDEPGGVDRLDLLDAAEAAGLKATTIATTLSSHPAIVRVGRGRWGLRGHTAAIAPEQAVKARPTQRPRPTAFFWTPTGALQVVFTVPRGPSPVIAIPGPIVDIIDGREFTAEQFGTVGRISIGNTKMWGFGPLLSGANLNSGDRAALTLNLIAGTATLNKLTDKEST